MTIKRHKLLAAGAVAASLIMASTVQVSPAAAAPGDKAKNVITEDFPDPGFAKFTTRNGGTRYYLYATGEGFRVARSKKPGVRYDIVGPSMTSRPRWTYEPEDGKSPLLWAPHVFQTAYEPGKERFTMYFAAVRESTGKHCIGAATSSSPIGPFAPRPRPLVCPPTGYNEAIDATDYVTTGGARYVVYKIGNYTPRRFKIVAARVSDTGIKRTGKPRTVLSTAQIGTSVADAPDVYRDANGRVHLFVSRNGYKDCDYATQVWSGRGLFALGNPRWVLGMGPSEGDRFCGPGGAEVFKDSKRLRIAFHIRTGTDPLTRPAWTGVLKRGRGTFVLS